MDNRSVSNHYIEYQDLFSDENRPEKYISYVYTVSELNISIKNYLEQNQIYKKLTVKGEISNYKLSPSGHSYFTLKDPTSEISCVLFKRSVSVLKFVPDNGQKVMVFAKLSAYTPRGQYQLIVDDIRQDGLGDIFLKIEQLKRKLNAEGLFDEKYKKIIPQYPEKVAVITSPSGAAVHDIIKTFKKRNDSIRLIIIPAKVQGEEAPESIVKALETANKIDGIDVIILGRGGGSIEDLMAFNSEIVARAIFASELPVISAVGHQIDYLISDLAADMRAATPTEAAQLLTKIKKEDLTETINSIIKDHSFILSERISDYKNKVYENLKRIIRKSPENKMDELSERLDHYLEKIYQRVKGKISEKNEILSRLMRHLKALSPFEILDRGYSITKKKISDEIVRNANDIKNDDIIQTIFSKGCVLSKVFETENQGAVQ